VMQMQITAYASSLLSFFFSFSFCAISNAGYRVSSRRVSLSSFRFSLGFVIIR